MERHIIAISGGGFSEEENAFIDTYLLKVIRKESKIKIAFVSTASNDAQGYIEKFYAAFKHEIPSHITINDFLLPNIQEIIDDLDVVYVGGGNTQYLLSIWRKTGFDKIIVEAYKKGVILAGISAGALCWFEKCFSEKNDNEYEEFAGLGILKGAFCPHYNDNNRKLAFDNWASKQLETPIYTLVDNENLHFINEKLSAKIIT